MIADDQESPDGKPCCSEKSIEDFSFDEGVEYILDSLNHTQYNQDAQDYFKQVMKHIKSFVVDDSEDREDTEECYKKAEPDGTAYADDDEDESCIIDHSPDEAYTQEIPCCENKSETIPLPFPTRDGVTEITLIKSHPPLSPMHDWEHRLSLVLYEILDTLENKKDHGFFDSIIDVQTHALLIDKAMRKYIEEHNKRWAKSVGREYEDKVDLQTTPAQIRHDNRGGYSTKDWRRIHKILTGEDYVSERKDSGDVQG